jgi:hypothetical protein
MENHFTESEEATFSAPSLLVHFIESFHRISRESLLFEKLFGKALAGFSRESALEALPNAPLVLSTPRLLMGLLGSWAKGSHLTWVISQASQSLCIPVQLAPF